MKKRIAQAAAAVAIATLGVASVDQAKAHDSSYCGYGSSGYYWVTVYVSAWSDSFAHYHQQWHSNSVSGAEHYRTRQCGDFVNGHY